MEETTSRVIGYVLELYGVGTLEQLIKKIENRGNGCKTLLVSEPR